MYVRSTDECSDYCNCYKIIIDDQHSDLDILDYPSAVVVLRLDFHNINGTCWQVKTKTNGNLISQIMIIIGYWICIQKYWMTWLEISVRTCEHRYQAKESNIFVYRFNNLIIICGMWIYQN